MSEIDEWIIVVVENRKWVCRALKIKIKWKKKNVTLYLVIGKPNVDFIELVCRRLVVDLDKPLLKSR